jgi:uncharacterized membrane protein
MKKKVVLLMLFVSVTLFAQQADDIIGKYRLPNKLDIEIYKNGNTYSGKIIALNGYQNGQTKDVKNSDKSKRNDNLLGKVIISNLKFDTSEKEWEDGKMYGPEKGMTVNLEITEFKDNYITIVGSKFVFWKTMKWQKIKE